MQNVDVVPHFRIEPGQKVCRKDGYRHHDNTEGMSVHSQVCLGAKLEKSQIYITEK